MSEKKKTSGKAFGVTGGSGVGLFLLKLASFISNPILKDLYTASVPMFSIIIGEIFTFTWSIYYVDPQEIRLKKRLKALKKKCEAVLNSTDPLISSDMRDKLQARYEVICGIEIGVYPLEIVNTLDGKETSAAQTQSVE